MKERLNIVITRIVMLRIRWRTETNKLEADCETDKMTCDDQSGDEDDEVFEKKKLR